MMSKPGGQILCDLKKAETELMGEQMIDSCLKQGGALEKVKALFRAQQVDRSDLDQFFKNPKSAFNMLFPQAPFTTNLTTTEEGTCQSVNQSVNSLLLTFE